MKTLALAFRSVLALCLFGLMLSSSGVRGAIAAAPLNDNFTNRFVLSGNHVTVLATNYYATKELGEPYHAGKSPDASLWWSWRASCAGRLKIAQTNTDFRGLRVAVYTGEVLTNLSQVATNRNISIWDAWDFPVEAGQTYQIATDIVNPGSSRYIFTMELDLGTFLMVQPVPQSHLAVGSPSMLSVTNTDFDYELARVDYFAGTNLVGTAEAFPFSLTWIPTKPGPIVLSAVATDSIGVRRQSRAVTVTIDPANDAFTNAIPIHPTAITATLAVDTTFASAEPSEPAHGGFPAKRSLWWQWTPKYAGKVTITPSTMIVPGSLVAYTGDHLTNLIQVAAYGKYNDKYLLTFQATPRTRYYLAIDSGSSSYNVNLNLKLQTLFASVTPGNRFLLGQTAKLEAVSTENDHPFELMEFLINDQIHSALSSPPWEVLWTPGEAGRYRFQVASTNSLGEARASETVELLVSPFNDDFTNALEIPSLIELSTYAESPTAGATYESGEPMFYWGLGRGSVWFTWVAPWTGASDFFSMEGSLSGACIVVYSGTALSNLVALNDAYSMKVPVTQGERYYIKAEACWGDQGSVRINVHPPPLNDNFSDAILLTEESGAFEGTNLGATAELGEPMVDADDYHSIWWRWVAPASGDFFYTAEDSLGMTVWGTAFCGDSVSNLVAMRNSSMVSSRDEAGEGSWNSATFRVHAGDIYYFRFIGGGSSGVIKVRYQFTIPAGLPANDDFEHRIVLTGRTNIVTADNTLCSAEIGEPESALCSPTGRSLWWSYIVPENGLLRIGADQTKIRVGCGVFRGESLTNLQPVSYSCDGPMFINVVKGEVLQIMADGAWECAGPVELEAVLLPPPSNDLFANSLVLEGTNVSFSASNLGASLEPDEPKQLAEAIGQTLWYSWTAPFTARVTIETSSSHMQPRPAVYTGTSLASLKKVVALDTAATAFAALAGTTYHIQVDSVGGPWDFTFGLRVEPFPLATNDNFADATVIKGGGVMGFMGSLVGATLESGEPDHLEGQPCKSIWWRWQAPFHGPAYFTASSSTAPYVTLAIYTGSALNDLKLIARSNDFFRLSITGGTTYYIAAVAPQDSIGDVALGMSLSDRYPETKPVVGNLLGEWSFEGTGLANFAHWHVSPGYGGSVDARGAADGATWITLPQGGTLWQSFATTPGQNYALRFALKSDPDQHLVRVRVSWDEQVLGIVEIAADEPVYWQWTNFAAAASLNSSRIKLENLQGSVGLDALSVVLANEPPGILQQPSDVSTLTGNAASFSVTARGSSPLYYQWFHNDTPLAGRTERTLVLESVSAAQVGSYFVCISNVYGSVTSAPARLVVEVLGRPLIVVQPYGATLAAGEYFAMSVSVAGSQPFTCQWFRDGLAIPNATNRHLVFNLAQVTNSGTYTVRIENQVETVWSLPATLVVRDFGFTGGTVRFLNQWMENGYMHSFPVYDVDGVTKVTGGNYIAQLYAGPTVELMRAVGNPREFRSDYPGIFWGDVVTIPSVPAGSNANVQVRVWDRTKGESYEEARALGGKFGKSEVFQAETGGVLPTTYPPIPSAPIYLSGLTSFSLSAGLPRFTVGEIQLAERRQDGTIIWTLNGQPGFKYVIERAAGDLVWRPILVLTNQTGTVTFIDPIEAANSLILYRARILD